MRDIDALPEELEWEIQWSPRRSPRRASIIANAPHDSFLSPAAIA
jgi:hypothetical protein